MLGPAPFHDRHCAEEIGNDIDADLFSYPELAEAVTKAIRVVPAWQRLYDRVYAGNPKRKPKARMAVMHKMVCAIWRVLKTKEGFNRLHNCPELAASKASSQLGTGLKEDRFSD